MKETDAADGITKATGLAEIRMSVFRLAWPAVLRMLLQTLVGMVDIIMIGRLGPQAIAAVSVGNRLVFVIIGALTAVTVGTTALVGRHVGAGNRQAAGEIMWQSLMSGVLVAALLALIGVFFSSQLLSGLTFLMEEGDPYILSQGGVYLRIVFCSMIFAVPMIIINAVLQGLGDMKTPLYIMVVANTLNVVGNYVLIFGIGVFPRLEVAGAALATGLSRVFGALIGVAVLIGGRSGVKLALRSLQFRLQWPILRDILSIGLPAAAEQLIRQSSQIIYTVLVAGLGTMALAANAIVMNIQSLAFMPGFGFGIAATTLVAQSLGAKKPDLAAEYGRQATYSAMIFMGLVALLFITCAPWLVRLYTRDPEVSSSAIVCLRIMAMVQPLFASVMVLAGALRGAGDTKWVMYVTAIGNWGVRLVASLLLGYYLGLGLVGFWIGVAVDVSVRGVLLWRRFGSGMWKNIRVIHARIGKTRPAES